MVEISDIGSVRSLVKVAWQKQVREIVLSPGSRNAPIILSFSAIEHFHCHSVLDERAAGFIALGMAQQLEKPVMLCCTSGSAMLGYAPALAEAYYQKIPLIAITADRPGEWIDQGEGQTIRQRHLLDGIVFQSFDLVNETDEDTSWHNQRLLNEAFELAWHKRLPVHINIPLREPLYHARAMDLSEPGYGFRVLGSNTEPSDEELETLRQVWAKSKSILVLASQMSGDDTLLEQLKHHHDDPRVAVVTETTANFYHFGFVSCIDRTIEGFLGTEAEAEYVPELLITIGSNIISKKVKAFLRRNKKRIQHHWHLGPDVMDTFQALTVVAACAPSGILSKMKSVAPEATSFFGTKWKSRFFHSEQLHNGFLETCDFCDLKAYQLILDFIPEGWQIQMGNSSVVRYIQLFNQLQGVRYFGNRGVSGIEGCTSTAVGAAIACGEPVLLISGDHAFRYDSNALSVQPVPDNLRMIVINNGGGNIFRIIDGPQDDSASERYIEKRDETSVKPLAERYGIVYHEAHGVSALEAVLQKIFNPEYHGCVIVEVFTSRTESPEILKNYFKTLKNGQT